MDDSYYCALVKQVEAHPLLKQEIDSIRQGERTSHFLNLVDVKWEDNLENNAIYRKIRDDTRTCFAKSMASGQDFAIENMHPKFPLILLATCRFFKQVEKSRAETAIVIQECEPLLKIINTMHSDLKGQDFYLRLDSKFSFINCTYHCQNCTKVRNKMQRGGCISKLIPPPGFIIPCPANTPVYDGLSIDDTFVSEIKRIYSDTFLAILQVEIISRYTFTDKFSPKGISHRVGGKVYKMIAFDEGKLYKSVTTNVGSDMEDYFHDDTLANSQLAVQDNRPVMTEDVSHGKRQRQPHMFMEDRAGCSHWGDKRQKLDFAEGASNGAAKSADRRDEPSEAAVMDMLIENNSWNEDDDKSLLDDLNVVAGAKPPNSSASTKRLFLEEGEDEDEETDTCQFNIVEAYPSTCKMKPKARLVVKETYEEII